MTYATLSDDPAILIPEPLFHPLADLSHLLEQGLNDRFYQELLGFAISACPNAQAGSVLQRQPAGHYAFVASCGYPLAELKRIPLSLDEALLQTPNGETVFLLHDIDAYNAKHMDPERCAQLRRYGRAREIQETLCVVVRQRGIIAAIVALDNFETRLAFSAQEVAFAQTLGALLEMITERAPAPFEAELSARQRQILTLLIKGCSNKQIAAALSLSPETVKKHLSQLYRKLGVSSRSQAISRAGGLR